MVDAIKIDNIVPEALTGDELISLQAVRPSSFKEYIGFIEEKRGSPELATRKGSREGCL